MGNKGAEALADALAGNEIVKSIQYVGELIVFMHNT